MMTESNKLWILFVYLVKGSEGYVFNQNGYNLKLLSVFCYFCSVLLLNLFGVPMDYCILACCLFFIIDVICNLIEYIRLVDGRVLLVVQFFINLLIVNLI